MPENYYIYTIPFQKDKLHILLIYNHPKFKIEKTIFTEVSLYKYSIVIGDLNMNNDRKKKNN